MRKQNRSQEQQLYLPKEEGGIGILHPNFRDKAIRVKRIMNLKNSENSDTWIALTK